MNYSSIRDNHKHGAVGDFLKESISKNSEVSIVSAYFTIYAYEKLKSQLNHIKKLRFLFGEPTFIRSNHDKINPQEFKIEDDKLSIPITSRMTQSALAKECIEWIQEKVEIRSMIQPNFLHGKLYHILQENGVEKAIAGSSNFTVNGLGLDKSKNIELNLMIDSDRDRQSLKKWFDELWNDLRDEKNQNGYVEDVKKEVIQYLEQLYKENEPEFIYYKTLFHIFEEYLNEQKLDDSIYNKTGFYDTEIFKKLYDFQIDGVKGAINKILKYNGCIIADSVGLGKTFEALAIIKYFELRNYRVLVICPKKLEHNWKIYQASQNNSLNPFVKDHFSFSLLYHTDMGRVSGKSDANGILFENFNWGVYDLVVIDESHNFRGNPMDKEKADGSTKMNRAKWLLEKVIKSGVQTKVLLLSATPVNNTLKDLRNQIFLITRGENSLSGESQVQDISGILKNAQTQFTNWADKKNRNTKQLLGKLLDSSFFTLLDELSIARSRKHIINYYNIDKIGAFPERKKPESVYPDIDTEDEFPTYDRINRQILEYKLSVFNPTAYVKIEMQNKYEELAGGKILNFKQSDRENYLIGMMKVNFLKRLESSIESFEISLGNTIDKIKKLEKKIQDYLKTKKEFSIDNSINNITEDVEDELDEWKVGKKLKFNLKDLDLEKWKNDLKDDRDALHSLYLSAKNISPIRDAKLIELKSLIQKKVQNPFNPSNQKVLIFTAFADTANYLYENLKDWFQNDLKLHSAMVCGSETKTSLGKNDYNNILINFSPLSKNRSQTHDLKDSKEEIDILIATDCISEGQNLQDCDYLINYDIHWNPVRIIQRFGRIDRLGSKNKSIQLVNFWPTKDLDNYINLKIRVEARMALVDITATGEENILNTEQLEDLIEEDLRYRNKQLERLKKEILDIEDLDDSISLTDFTLDDFRRELLNLFDKYKLKLKNSPMGLYAVVPAPGGKYSNLYGKKEFTSTEKEIIQSGVIFCLKHKFENEDNVQINPLNPFFLVYVRMDDGVIRYNYTNAKQILEIYRSLCQGESAQFQGLCDTFNQETVNGTKMAKYTELLRKSANEIVNVFRKKSNLKLTASRSALITAPIRELNDFELITWLVIL